MLAGVSVTWYTWLEQGRRINASADVLRAIGRALRLDEAGTEHLLALAQPSIGAPADATTAFGPDDVPSALRRLIDAFEPAPAYVLGPRWEFAAWNAAEARLYPAITALQPPERNLLWVLFADPATRGLIVDWDIHAKQSLAEFRASTTAMRDDPALLALVERLRAISPEFEQWWHEHDVARFETRLRRFDHPAAGLLTFEYQLLTPDEWPSLTVAVHLPVPGDDSARRLAVRHHVVRVSTLSLGARVGRADERLRRTQSLAAASKLALPPHWGLPPPGPPDGDVARHGRRPRQHAGVASGRGRRRGRVRRAGCRWGTWPGCRCRRPPGRSCRARATTGGRHRWRCRPARRAATVSNAHTARLPPGASTVRRSIDPARIGWAKGNTSTFTGVHSPAGSGAASASAWVCTGRSRWRRRRAPAGWRAAIRSGCTAPDRRGGSRTASPRGRCRARRCGSTG